MLGFAGRSSVKAHHLPNFESIAVHSLYVTPLYVKGKTHTGSVLFDVSCSSSLKDMKGRMMCYASYLANSIDDKQVSFVAFVPSLRL